MPVNPGARAAAYSLIAASAGLFPLPVCAHLVDLGTPGAEFHVWSVDPLAVVLLLAIALVYWRGSRELARRNLSDRPRFEKRRRYFWLGWAGLVASLATPIDSLGEQLFFVHMVQHELMMLIAAPFLVLSRPSSALLKGLPPRLRGAAAWPVAQRRAANIWSLALTPAVAWTIHAVGLWGWHIPALFNAGLRNTWVHSLQHLSFLLISLIFWFALLRPQPINSAVAVVYLFTTAIHASLLGALLTFSPSVWYQPYLNTAPAWGISALQDQQLGGLIMWMPAGVVFIAAAMMLIARLLAGNCAEAGEIPSRRSGR